MKINSGSVSKTIVSVHLALAFVLAGCSQGPLGMDWQSSQQAGFNGAADVSNSYEQQALSIIQTNCTSCHTTASGPSNIYDLTDPQHWVSRSRSSNSVTAL